MSVKILYQWTSIINICIHWHLKWIRTYLQAPLGNPGSDSGFSPLWHVLECHSHSFVGQDVIQCNGSPPEEHARKTEKGKHYLNSMQYRKKKKMLFCAVTFYNSNANRTSRFLQSPYHHHLAQQTGCGTLLCSSPWCLSNCKVVTLHGAAEAWGFDEQLHASQLLFTEIEQTNFSQC